MIAIKAGTIYTINNSNEIIKKGIILINDDGNIQDIFNTENAGDIKIPQGTEIIDAQEDVVFPGMVDAHTHLGLLVDGISPEVARDHNEMTNPVTPHLEVIDAIDPFDPAFQEVRSAGITTVMIAPGSANPIGGRCSVLKTLGKSVEEMLRVKNAGMKMALGENPRRVYGNRDKAPGTRMGIMGIIRENFQKTYNYLQKKEEKKLKGEKFNDTDIKMESLADLLLKRIPARIHCHKAQDILTALRIKNEFNLNITLEHCTEGQKVMEKIKENNVQVVLSPMMNARQKDETRERNFEQAGILANYGIKVSVATDGFSQPARWLPLNAGLCIRYGMKEEDALRSITINPAQVLGLDDKLGSIEKGKIADLVIMDGHPLEVRTRVKRVFIDGKIVYPQSKTGGNK